MGAQHYTNSKGLIVSSNTASVFKTMDYSFNLDGKPAANILFRTEAGLLNARERFL